MINEALFRYSADKTGLADFGLESAGKIFRYLENGYLEASTSFHVLG